MVIPATLALLATTGVLDTQVPVLLTDTLRPAGCDYEIDEEILRGPTFTPFHERPRQIDRPWLIEELQHQVAEVQPSGRLEPVSYWVLVAPRGCVVRIEITSGSGDPRVDALIQRWLGSAEFTRPLLRSGHAQPREAAVAVWLQEHLDLSPDSG